MKRLLVIAASLALAACGSAAEDAERQYEIVAQSGSRAERCSAAKKVVDRWLEAQNRAKYDYWRSKRDVDCTFAAAGID